MKIPLVIQQTKSVIVFHSCRVIFRLLPGSVIPSVDGTPVQMYTLHSKGYIFVKAPLYHVEVYFVAFLESCVEHH